MNVILGAGMAGIGAYYRDDSFEIYEKDEQAGGLCGRFKVEAGSSGKIFYFDKAVHLSFTSNPVVKEAFARAAHNTYHPVPHSWFHNMWLQHPAQNNLYPLSTEFKVQALEGFINRNQNDQPHNFKEWLLFQYGGFLFEKLFKPYNEKYWCTNLEQMDINWVGGRFYRPTIDEVLYGSYTDQTPNTYYAKEMRYPQKGGYRGYINHIIEKAEKTGKIHYGYEAEKIDVSNKIIKFCNGETKSYDKLLSSVPLPVIMERISGVPFRLKRCAEELEYTSMALVSFGFDRVIDCMDIWFYIYDTDIMAARAYVPSLKSSDNVPSGCSSIQFEIYFNSKSPHPDEKECIQNCIYALEKFHLAGADDIIASDFRVIEYGNVIFKQDTCSKVQDILNWLDGLEIYSIGRFGRWEYLWSDQSFLSGYETAANIQRRMKNG